MIWKLIFPWRVIETSFLLSRIMGWTVIQRVGLLPGSKIIGKSSLSMIPLIGWCWLFTESIFIQRQWESDKRKLTEGFDKILNNYPEGHYFNVCSIQSESKLPNPNFARQFRSIHFLLSRLCRCKDKKWIGRNTRIQTPKLYTFKESAHRVLQNDTIS